MSRFECGWLSLREPLDAASRAPGIAQTLNRVLRALPVHVTDLASGTGANLRYLSPMLGDRQEWCLIDHDQGLLDATPVRMIEWAERRGVNVTQLDKELDISGPDFACHVRMERKDLATDLAAIDLREGALVSASGLLDLVSESWLQEMARRCSIVRAAVLFALTYDGRMRFAPSEPEDGRVRDLVNRHQLTGKGFGKALGPAAAQKAVQTFTELGYCVEVEFSDWRIEPSERGLQDALLDIWLSAAVEIAPDEAPALKSWYRRRRAHVAANRSELHVGHSDILGWIPDTRR